MNVSITVLLAICSGVELLNGLLSWFMYIHNRAVYLDRKTRKNDYNRKLYERIAVRHVLISITLMVLAILAQEYAW